MRTAWLILTLVSTGAIRSADGQSFNSGSNGSDGALNLTTPGTIIFDPKSFTPPLDPDGDNIYHFTTINIGTGVTVKLSAKVLSGPVFWLAQGAVTINGTIDLNGDDGYAPNSLPAARAPSTPGAGGFSGGVGSFGTSPDQPGNGPGGGGTGNNGCGRQGEGHFTGNQFIVPLIGGSGGAGRGDGGGAGGGALLIASSSTITLNGLITANGGRQGNLDTGGGGGSGGGIRLAAVSITGSGGLSVAGGTGCGTSRNDGLIRLEGYQINVTGSLNGPVARATPFNTFLPTTQPTVRVLSVAGVPVPPSPTGSFTIPDVTINSGAAVPFAIQAQNIPVGTVVQLQIFSENGPDLTVAASPLAGTLASSTATASAVLPSGFSRGYVKATWTQ